MRSIKRWMMAGVMALVSTTVVACGSQTASAPKPLAVVNGQALTGADWKLAVNATDLLQGVSMSTSKSAEQQQVKELASELAVEQWALKHHVVTVTAAQKNAQAFVKGNVTAALGSGSKLTAALAKYHLTVASLTQFMTQQMELQAAFAQETKSITSLPKGTASAYYKAHQSLFASPKQVEMRMILVKTQVLAQKLMSELQHGGSWSALARKYSLDTYSKGKGGEYGWVNTGPQSGFVTPFYQEMDKLSPGQYGIAHTQYGYHVIEVQAARPGKVQPYSAVKSKLVTSLLTQKKDLFFQAFSNKVVKSGKVNIIF